MIGKSLKELRKDRGYKQEWVASQTGISQTHVSQIENGNRKPPIDILERFALFYGINSIEKIITNAFRDGKENYTKTE